MENTSTEKIQAINKAQKEFFLSGATLDIRFRKEMLKKLGAIVDNCSIITLAVERTAFREQVECTLRNIYFKSWNFLC